MNGWQPGPSLPFLAGAVGGGIRRLTSVVGPACSWGSDPFRLYLEECLELSHGLGAALGGPLTLRLGLHPGDLDLNPPQPSDPSGTRPL
jgi:hypothetical protein